MRITNTSQRINPKAGPRPASSPMSSVLMGGSGLTGTLATLLGDPPQCPLCGKLKVISPPLAPCPTTSSSRIRYRHHSSAAVVALHTYISSHGLSVRTSDHIYSSQLRCPPVVVENNAYQRTAPAIYSLSLRSASVSCLLKGRVRLALLFTTHSQAASDKWELKAARERGKDGSS